MSDKKVLVLVEDEHKEYDILKNLGITTHYDKYLSRLCRITSTAEKEAAKQQKITMYKWEKFGLLVDDNKLVQYAKHVDGVIIIMDTQKSHKRVLSLLSQLHDQIVWTIFTDQNISFQVQQKKHLFGSSNKDYFNNQIELAQLKEDIETSQTISNDELIQGFTHGTLPLSMWDHYGRLRIVYLAIVKLGWAKAIDPNGWLCKSWRRYKTSIGHGHLWHYTLTRFWGNLLHDLQKKNKYKNFSELYNDPNNQFLHSGRLFQKYYTNDVLFSDKARKQWVSPNKDPN